MKDAEAELKQLHSLTLCLFQRLGNRACITLLPPAPTMQSLLSKKAARYKICKPTNFLRLIRAMLKFLYPQDIYYDLISQICIVLKQFCFRAVVYS